MPRLLFILLLVCHFSSPCFATDNKSYHFLVSSVEKRLTGFVQNTVDKLHYSHYKMGGSHFDTNKGVYIVDCSNYVDQILQAVSPNAYINLVNSTGAEIPTTRHYYDFFSDLEDEPFWNKIDGIENLRAGDVIVFRYKKRRHGATSGHVMVVMDKPIKSANNYLLRVTDSASSGHSQDTRLPHKSGIGIGTLVLKADPKTGQPAAYAWKEGSCWKRNVSFAMARPMDVR